MVAIMNNIICNKIRTPDGTILISTSRHDYRVYTDANGHEYMVDGGTEYLRRNVVHEAPYEELSLYDTDPHEKLRENYTWGTYGKNGDEPLQLKLLKDLSTNHIKAIIETQKHLQKHIVKMFENELEYRNER